METIGQTLEKAFQCCMFISVPRKLESKKKQLERLKDQLQKLEVQATDKVNCSIL